MFVFMDSFDSISNDLDISTLYGPGSSVINPSTASGNPPVISVSMSILSTHALMHSTRNTEHILISVIRRILNTLRIYSINVTWRYLLINDSIPSTLAFGLSHTEIISSSCRQTLRQDRE